MNQNETVLLQRTLDAPIEAVWDAWADSDKLAAWWRISSTKQTVITEYDFRPGGTWRQHAIMNEGFSIGEHNPGVKFKEIIPLEKIVTVPNVIEGEVIEVVQGLMETVITFEPVSDNQTKVSLIVVHNGTTDGKPGDLAQTVYEEIFDNLAKFITDK